MYSCNNNKATAHYNVPKEGKSMSKKKFNVAICGYGNLGKGAEKAIARISDVELVGIITRRPEDVAKETSAKVYSEDEAETLADKVDVLIMCSGSATDLPVQVPKFAEKFNTACSFDTHKNIPEYLEAVGESAKAGGKLAICSNGWDPGLFSVIRQIIAAIFPGMKVYTFWGEGVSQGHSDAIRRINGVKDARQYTVPIQEAVDRVLKGENPELTDYDMHKRVCYVVAEEGANQAEIERQIVTMPNYFAGYQTEVNFISEEELKANHSGLPHGGFVIAIVETSPGVRQKIEFRLDLDSNPEFTGSVLVAYARAAYRMNQQGMTGAITPLHVPPIMLDPRDEAEVIDPKAHIL